MFNAWSDYIYWLPLAHGVMEEKRTLELDLGYTPNSTTHKFFGFQAENAYIFWALSLSSCNGDDLIITQG